MATATRPRTTLADMLPGERVRDAVVVVLGAVLTGLAAQVSFHIPGTPVPVTGQTFAVLLTGGKTTREAAAALFLSPKTVEYHLRHVYQKLGIHSRDELALLLAAQGVPAGDRPGT